MKRLLPILLLAALCLPAFRPGYQTERILVSTDIGGGDQDDFQSMVHLLHYERFFDIEGVVSSYPQVGRAWWKIIRRAYKKDVRKGLLPRPSIFPRFALGSRRPFSGRNKSRGMRLILRAAAKEDERMLNVLVWGSLTDVAMALKRRPSIAKKIRVYAITGWNRLRDRRAYDYVKKAQRRLGFPFIGADNTVRGMYLTGFGAGPFSNRAFPNRVLRKAGRLGRAYWKFSDRINVGRYGIKMGDTPSVFFVMNGNWNDPTRPSWGGQFCKAGRNYWKDCGNGRPNTVAKHRRDFLMHWEDLLR